jgi:hypothetical protein
MTVCGDVRTLIGTLPSRLSFAATSKQSGRPLRTGSERGPGAEALRLYAARDGFVQIARLLRLPGPRFF